MNQAIPPPDPLPMPGPYWLFHVLLLVTFALHLAAMNGLFGGGLLAALALTRRGPGDALLARRVLPSLPTFFAATVTLGVAPLLFAQVLYGRLLYTSSVLMAWPWLGVVGLALAGYSLAYVLKARTGPDRLPSAPLAWTMVALLAAIAFVFVNNLTLMLAPERWQAMYFENPRGLRLNLADPQVVPRALHVLTGAVVVGAVVVGLLVRGRTEDPGASQAASRTVLRALLAATLLQFPLGAWFVLAQPARVRDGLLGGSPHGTGILVLGVLLAAGMAFHAFRALRARREEAAIPRLAWFAGVVLVLMVLLRDEVRRAWLAPVFNAADQPAAPRWDVLGVFLVVFVGGLAVLAWLIGIARAPREPATTGP